VVLTVAVHHQAHQHGQAGQGLLTLASVEAVEDVTAEAVMEGTATGGVIAPKADDHR